MGAWWDSGCGGGGRDVPYRRISMQKCHTHFSSLVHEHTSWSASKYKIPSHLSSQLV